MGRVRALDAVAAKYTARGKTVEIIGRDRPSAELHGDLTGTPTGAH